MLITTKNKDSRRVQRVIDSVRNFHQFKTAEKLAGCFALSYPDALCVISVHSSMLMVKRSQVCPVEELV